MTNAICNPTDFFTTLLALRRLHMIPKSARTYKPVSGGWPQQLLAAYTQQIITDEPSFNEFVADNNPEYKLKWSRISPWIIKNI